MKREDTWRLHDEVVVTLYNRMKVSPERQASVDALCDDILKKLPKDAVTAEMIVALDKARFHVIKQYLEWHKN